MQDDAKTKEVKNPCRSCIYFKACGSNTRTEPCRGRQTITEWKKTLQKSATYVGTGRVV